MRLATNTQSKILFHAPMVELVQIIRFMNRKYE